MSLFFYRALLYLGLPVFLVRFLWRSWRNPACSKRLGERFGLGQLPEASNCIWLHAVSVGEVNAAIPLVTALEHDYPDSRILVTTMTTTGSDRVVQAFGERVLHCYLPYDFPGSVKRFLRKTNPNLGLVMETEIWPNLIHACQQHDVPLIYTNVRLSERSYQGYRKVRALFKPLLSTVRRFALQADEDAARLVALGAPEHLVEVTGSLKFDMQLPASTLEIGQSLRRQLGIDRPIVIAASTHDGEDELLLDSYSRMKPAKSDLLLVLVPRHPERFDLVYRLCQKRGLTTTRSSSGLDSVSTGTDIVVVDQMGLLPQYICAADVTFMGGSLVPTGGHNLLEPAALGKAVVFGPHMFNFSGISRLFCELQAGIQVDSAQQLDDVFLRLLDDDELRGKYGAAGQKLIEENRGALARVSRIIHQVLPRQ